ncbi:recombinase family protein [Nitrospirillum pindoramense]|uniref:DNA invertase Pin-like site-specific DNA recombinase n=1 Tax=Nitrospirillum amazonense TaxID=28077 RepID=A0A560H8X5_9PROT|nr:recombinase family protein [Nitrospirillum amazonense]TWB41940.1 DNA invertase Pin-like site-specific DNA recombinase [Nitrospirillum amazonense]
MAAAKIVAYYRVSTKRQGQSGLGLEAQQAAVLGYLKGTCGGLVAEFTEIESGKVNTRPQLQAALAACRLHSATLVIAKLDRLSRNAAFLLSLRDAGVDFVAADMPNANRLTVGIMAVVAEAEREMISARTKEALAAAKARGVVLGGDRGHLASVSAQGRVIALEKRRAKALQRARDLAPIIRELQASGITSARGLAKALNARGWPAPRGGEWQTSQLQIVLRNLAAA